MIHALNPQARALGVSRGQTQADALAMVPGLTCRPADIAADLRALQGLAIWAERWSPAVTIDTTEAGREGLWLDVTGAPHLFGGESALLAGIERRLAQAGVHARAALAETPGAAWAMARWVGRADGRLVTPGGGRAALSDLPVEALRLDDATVRQARRFGLKRIGDLYDMPRAGLARRFREGTKSAGTERGVALVRRLDQALGFTAEALVPTRAPARYRAWEAHAEPIGDIAGVEGRLPELAADLSAALEKDGQGARSLTLTAFRTDGRTTALSIKLGLAGRDAGVWMRLFRERGLERLDLGFGADALMLNADLTEPVVAHQVSMEDEDAARHAESLTALIDRLSARLGEAAVQVAEPQGSWIPERAERWRPALGTLGLATVPPPGATVCGDADRARPILMLDPPEPVEAIAELPDGAPAQFTWRRVSRRVSRADGPERLSPEWWRPRPGSGGQNGDDPYGRQVRTRDYYRVEDDQGLRYWLFREGLYGWDYTGADDQRAPSWWMHGMFA
ncbi:DNA polymerase Y family protein [soil metagenome]